MKLLLTGNSLQKFCDIIGNAKYLSEVITLYFSEDGIYSQGMTVDHCALYELTIKSKWFDDYEWEIDKDVEIISVSTEILSKVIQTRQPSQYMVIEFYGEPDSLTVRFASAASQSSNQEFPKEFSLPLIETDNDKLTIPSVDYSAEFGIGSKAMQITNDQLSLFNETLTIHCSEDEIYLRSKGNEGELKVTLFNDKCEHITEFSIDEDLSLTLDFTIKHFNTFCKFLKVSDNVSLGFTKDYPMKFEYIMNADNADNDNDHSSGDDNNNIKLAFYLAPKISDDA